MVTYMMSLTAFHARRPAASALALLACVALCPPGAAAPGAKKGEGKKPSAPPNLSAIIQSPTLTIGDPKLPGKLLAVVKAAGFSGGSGGEGFLGNMTQVHARLYQKGVPAATLDAPRARGSQNSATKNLVVTATGGVVIVSLTEPGTRLTSDTAVWYASLNRIVATGHVVYHKAKQSLTLQTSAMTVDTRLNSYHSAGGSLSGRF